MAPAFAKSVDFAISKPAGRPCPNLLADSRCGIHGDLRERGFRGCTVFDCFGAGQHVSQVTFGGQDWREHRADAAQMLAAFAVVRQLNELRWYLTAALDLPAATSICGELTASLTATEAMTDRSALELTRLDVAGHRDKVNLLLRRASALQRSAGGEAGADHSGAMLLGADLTRVGLRRASLRGACLIGAILRGVNLGYADLTGADLRDADLAGADLSRALFVTQAQLTAAIGDAATLLPAGLSRPAHWCQ